MLHFLALHEENLPINEIIDELLSLTMAGHESKSCSVLYLKISYFLLLNSYGKHLVICLCRPCSEPRVSGDSSC
jgi:hypothetical protein